MNRMGPEGLGDMNEGDDQAAYQEDAEEPPATNSASPSRDDSSSTIALLAGYIMHNNGSSCPEVPVLTHRAGLFLSTLAAGCQECLPDSTTSTTMVSNPLDVFQALANGFTPGTLSSLTRAVGPSTADQAQLCTAGFASDQDDPDRQHLPAEVTKNPIFHTPTTVVSRIIDAEVLEAIAQLIYWVNAMHFAALVMRYVLAHHSFASLIFITLAIGNQNNLGELSMIYSIRWLRIWAVLDTPRLGYLC